MEVNMKYNVISSVQFTYPDIWEYPADSQIIDIFSARGSYASYQILFAERVSADISVSFDGLPEGAAAEVYTLTPIEVEKNIWIEEEQYQPHHPERIAPYKVYDCLRTFDSTLDLTDGTGGLYIAIKIDRDAEPGDYTAYMIADGTKIPIHLKIYAAQVPEESLKMVNGFNGGQTASWHNVPEGTDAYYAMEEKYLAMLRRMHQNMMYVSGIVPRKVDELKWEFDFTEFLSQVHRYGKAGIKWFKTVSFGRRRSWSESVILVGDGIDSMSYEGYCYISQFLAAFRKVLIENNLLDKCIMSVSDEPNSANCTTFRALCGLIRKLFPELRLADAMSYGDLHGALDIWIPLNAEYDKHRAEIETLRQAGDEIWHYVCCVPREYGYINRLMDYPLLSTRYLHWGNYKYNLTGYLHWAANRYQPGQNPFIQSCPEHRNADSVCYLPAGDTHIIYPGSDGPWMSIRLEAERESAEDYEMLKLLAETDREKADEICESVFHSFKDVEYDVEKFTEAKKALLKALS